jgi:hypothetical protein
MAKKGDDHPKSCDFQINSPTQPDVSHPENDVYVADNGPVVVTVDDQGSPCVGLSAAIGSASASLTQNPVTGIWSGSVSVGQFTDSLPGVANRTVSVSASGGPTQNQPFRAVHPGSTTGSSGSGSQSILAAAALAEVFQEGRPAPVSVSAEFGAPPELGGPRVEAAVLVYSGAPGFERCWFSQPIDLRSVGTDPALWVLERSDARTWLLRLRRGGLDLVVYRHTSAAERDCVWPVQLGFESDGAGEGVDWPATVTLSPAP